MVDTGVAWLGAVRSAWRRVPLWTLFKRVKRTAFEQEQLLSVYRDHGVVPKVSRDDNFNKPSGDLSLYQLVEPGDLAINKMKAWQGSVAISEHRGIVSPAYFVFAARHRENSRFLHYMFRSAEFTAGYFSISKGIRPNQWDLEPQEHSRMLVPLPSLAEQAAIAAFLDRETAKIDALVEEQRRLIELLNEKRQAVISYAVTRGINSDADMRRSGVGWLGDVPEHWRVVKLNRIATRIVDGAHFTPTYVDEGVPFLRVTDITRPSIELDEVKRIPLEEHQELSKRCRPEKGDLLLSKNGTIGVPKVVSWDWEFSIFVSLCLIKPTAELDPHYASYVFLSRAIESQIDEGSKQSTVTNLHLEKIAGFQFPLPPLEDQRNIVSSLDEAVGKLMR
jgi:type I restriction enzyme S subunit